jgi:MFS family permease
MSNGTTPNAQRLLWAGFFAIFASGVGFSVRAGVLLDWARSYGFTMSELGDITGGGLTGFGVIILLGAAIADKVGYPRLMIFAFIAHVLSAVLQLASDPIYHGFGAHGQAAVGWSLYVAMFLFAIGNGTCEAVVNPMVAALFPTRKTHYLNILHAGWPGGLIAGGVISYVMNGNSIAGFHIPKIHWLIQMSMFLVPTFIYGIMMWNQPFPKSEAGAAGVSYRTMLLEFAAPVLLVLLLIHAMVGYVELGTDSWISKITGSIMADPGKGMLLFIYTSSLMFALRFVAGPIVHRLSPLGLLCIGAILGALGLTLLGNAEGIMFCVLAATVYAAGKTFLWPTMLAVVSERFPRGGSITLGAVGGVGMLSAGLLGGPGIGFQQDYYAASELKKPESQPTYKRYEAAGDNSFLGIFSTRGLDGTKVAVLELAAVKRDLLKKKQDLQEKNPADDAEKKQIEEKIKGIDDNLAENEKEFDKAFKEKDKADEKETIKDWWERNEIYAFPPKDDDKKNADKQLIESASLFGGRMALKLTAIVPAMMAVLYLLLILYFRSKGGYKHVEIQEPPHTDF